MTRKEEIIQVTIQKGKEVEFTQIVKEAKGVNSAYGIGFLEGAEWADEHPDIEAIKAIEDHAYFAGSEAMREKMTNKACEWLKDNWRKHVWLDGDNIIHFGLLENDFRKAMKGE